MQKTPQVKYISIICADDSVAIMQFVLRVWTDAGILEREGTPNEIEAEINKTSWAPEKLPLKSWREITPESIPQDRYFREAWKDNGDGLDIHLPKAIEIQKTKIRKHRISKLSELDTAYMRADEAGNTAEKIRIAAMKQKLRDATKDEHFAHCTCPEDIKQVGKDLLE